jgi:hypothetical protein
MTRADQSASGFNFSKQFVEQLSDKELRDAFMADQVRTRIALLIRALREQDSRQWSQTELGRRAGKPQNVVSRLEDPDYGRLTLETLLKVAAAFDLPIIVDMPEWEDWFQKMSDFSPEAMHRHSFDLKRLSKIADVGQTTKQSEAVIAFARMLTGQQAINGLYTAASNQNSMHQPLNGMIGGATKAAKAVAA